MLSQEAIFLAGIGFRRNPNGKSRFESDHSRKLAIAGARVGQDRTFQGECGGKGRQYEGRASAGLRRDQVRHALAQDRLSGLPLKFQLGAGFSGGHRL